MQCFPDFAVVSHAIGVVADVHDVTVLKDSVNESRCHYFVTEDIPPLVESLVGCQHGGSVFVATAHELEENHRAGLADWDVSNLIDNQQRRIGEHREPLFEVSETATRQDQTIWWSASHSPFSRISVPRSSGNKVRWPSPGDGFTVPYAVSGSPSQITCSNALNRCE